MASHSFDVLLAEEYNSIEIALLISHFQFWIIRNRRLGLNEKEGRTWTYQSLEEIASHYNYWSYDQVRRLVKKALDLGIIIKKNFNENKWDKRCWYAFENEEKFNIRRFRRIEDAKSPDQPGEIAGSYKDTDTIPDSSNIFDDDSRAGVGCGKVDNLRGVDDDDAAKKAAHSDDSSSPRVTCDGIVVKEKPNGDKITCSKKEYYRYVILAKLPWETEEIEGAWEKFCNSVAKIGDYMKYIDQIIKTERDRLCLNSQMKKEKNEKKDLKKENKNIYTETLEQDSRKRAYPIFTSPLLSKDKN